MRWRNQPASLPLSIKPRPSWDVLQRVSPSRLELTPSLLGFWEVDAFCLSAEMFETEWPIFVERITNFRTHREIPGAFDSKLPKRTRCSAKGTNEQHWTVHNCLFRIGVESGSSNQREKARGFSQWMPNSYFLEYKIEDRGSRIEDLESASETTSWITETAEKKSDGQRGRCRHGNPWLPQQGSQGQNGYVCCFILLIHNCLIRFGFVKI